MMPPNKATLVHVDESVDVIKSELASDDKPKADAPKKEEKKAEVDSKSHLSSADLGDVHSVSILFWRRPLTIGSEIKPGEVWELRHGIMYALYGFTSVILLIVQITFLWSLMDSFAAETGDKEAKGTLPSMKWTPEMSYLELPENKLMSLIAKWNASERCPGGDFTTCQASIRRCAASWSSNTPCSDDADFIKKKCMPWDYETVLGGQNGTKQIKYVGHDARIYYGGMPDLGSINKHVILNWALQLDASCPLYGRLKYSYIFAEKYSYGSEILSIAVFSYVFFLAILIGDLGQLMSQCILSVDLPVSDKVTAKFSILQPICNLVGDVFIALRIIFLSSVTPVCAMLMTKDHGVQAVLSGAIATTFILNLDDLVFTALQKSMMMGKTTIFKKYIDPLYSDVIKYRDTRPVLPERNLYFGRFRTIVVIVYCHILYIISTVMAYNIAMGYRSPSYYFSSSNGYAVVGGISMGTYLCCCIVMYRGTVRSAVAMVQQGIALLWVYMLFFKVVIFGLLFWGTDVAMARRCDFDHDVCETAGETVRRLLGNHFRLYSRDVFQREQLLTGVGETLELDWTYSSMIVAFYVCIPIHCLMVFANSDHLWDSVYDPKAAPEEAGADAAAGGSDKAAGRPALGGAMKVAAMGAVAHGALAEGEGAPADAGHDSAV